MRLRPALVQVYTGDGKGKTTAAVGLAVRAAGRELRVCFVQFVKGGERSGELDPLERLGVRVVRPAERSTGLLEGGITPEDRAAAERAWDAAEEALGSGEYDVVVLDEVCVAVRAGLGDAKRLLAALDGRPDGVEVVCTGRGAPTELVERADLVTEMCAVKHPLASGVPARRGIDF